MCRVQLVQPAPDAYLLAWCPYLEDLRIDTDDSISMGGPWFQPLDLTCKTPPTESRLKPTRLVSLVLVNVRVKHQDLQDLLEASPWLRDLRVFFTVYHAREEVLFDCEEFVRYARIFFSDNSRQPLEKFLQRRPAPRAPGAASGL